MIVKLLKTKIKEKIVKSVREKRDTNLRMDTNFSLETKVLSKRQWKNGFKVQKENKMST